MEIQLNEKYSNGIANSNKGYNKRQQEKLENQIVYARKSHHQKYQESRLQNENLNAAANSVPSLINSNSHKWPKDTLFIFGDSTISGINERQLSRKKQVRVRLFLVASLEDMYDYLSIPAESPWNSNFSFRWK